MQTSRLATFVTVLFLSTSCTTKQGKIDQIVDASSTADDQDCAWVQAFESKETTFMKAIRLSADETPVTSQLFYCCGNPSGTSPTCQKATWNEAPGYGGVSQEADDSTLSTRMTQARSGLQTATQAGREWGQENIDRHQSSEEAEPSSGVPQTQKEENVETTTIEPAKTVDVPQYTVDDTTYYCATYGRPTTSGSSLAVIFYTNDSFYLTCGNEAQTRYRLRNATGICVEATLEGPATCEVIRSGKTSKLMVSKGGVIHCKKEQPCAQQ